jgi:hypothetical protein
MEPLQGAKKFSHMGDGTTSATATESTPTSQRIYITDLVASSDKAGAILTVKQGGSSTPFSIQLSAATATGTPTALAIHFQTPIIITANNNAVAEVDGTDICRVNMTGYVAN